MQIESKDGGVERHYRGCVGVVTVESDKVYMLHAWGCLGVYSRGFESLATCIGGQPTM